MSALVGPHSGRRIDRWGSRPVLMTTSAIFALGLGLLAVATGPVSPFVAIVGMRRAELPAAGSHSTNLPWPIRLR